LGGVNVEFDLRFEVNVYLTEAGLCKKEIDQSYSCRFKINESCTSHYCEKFLKNEEYSKYFSERLILELLAKPYYCERASRALCGYVGLKNEGTTCYINALL
jgi:hypothetical protein